MTTEKTQLSFKDALRHGWRLFVARPWFIATFAPLVALTFALVGMLVFELPIAFLAQWGGESAGTLLLLVLFTLMALSFGYDLLTNFYSQLVSQLFYLQTAQSPWPTYRAVLRDGLDFHLFVYFAGMVLLNMLIGAGILIFAALLAGLLLLFVAPAAAIGVGVLVAFGLWWYIFTRLLFAPLYVLEHRTNPLDAIRWSWERTQPVWQKLLLWPLVGLLLVFAGLLAFGVGVFVVVFVLPLAQVALYVQLQGRRLPEPPAPAWGAFAGYVIALLLSMALLVAAAVVLERVAPEQALPTPDQMQQPPLPQDRQLTP